MLTSGIVTIVVGLLFLTFLETLRPNLARNDEVGIPTSSLTVLRQQCTYHLSISLRIISKNRQNMTISPKHCMTTKMILYLLILQCGDVEAQPGPREVKFPCGICSKNVGWNAKAIQCDGCDIWYHSKCTNISPKTFSLLRQSSLTWICAKCGIPNVSSCHSFDLGEHSSVNLYVNLPRADTELSLNTSGHKLQYNQVPPPSSTPRKDYVYHTDIGESNISKSSTNHDSRERASPSRYSSHSASIQSEPESPIIVESTVNDTPDISTNQSSFLPKDQFSCVVINFQSVKNKQTELYNIISCTQPDIIIGDETHLDPDYLDSEILPHGIPEEHCYKIFRKDRKSMVNKGGGGVMVMVKPCYDTEECPELDTECELKWIKVTTSKKDHL